MFAGVRRILGFGNSAERAPSLRLGRWAAIILAMLLATSASIATARAAQPRSLRNVGADLEQCANGSGGGQDCTNATFQKGDLNRQNALYRGGDFVPFRVVITGLSAGQEYTLRIGYDAVEKDLHAYDYLGTYDASAAPGQTIVPCAGTTGTDGAHACGMGASTVAVPTDTNTHFVAGRSQKPGSFSAWGGTFTGSPTYVSPSPINVVGSGTIERQIDISFRAEGGTVVIAWGGHVASDLDWGVGNTFIDTNSGAPFHMRLHTIDGESLGSADLSLHANAVAPTPDDFITRAAPTPVEVGETVIERAIFSGAAAPRVGSVAFHVCFDASEPPDCVTNGKSVGEGSVVDLGEAVEAEQISGGVAAVEFSPEQPGHYCFRAEFTPAPGSPFSGAEHVTDHENFDPLECIEATLPAPTLSVTKICVGSTDGLFTFHVDTFEQMLECGASTAPIELGPGSHTVSETQAPDFEPPTIGGDCAPSGAIALAPGDSATCTITNVHASAPPVSQLPTLIVNKACVPATDPGRFNLFIDEAVFRDVACGASTGPVTMGEGTHTVSEQGGSFTHLNGYTSVIGGACAADGTVTLTAGANAVCTITNTRRPPRPQPTLAVKVVCVPPDDPGHFSIRGRGLHISLGEIGCGESTQAIEIDPGRHRIGAAGGAGTNLGEYEETIGGDCTPNGIFVVFRGEAAVCTISFVHKRQPSATLTLDKFCVPSDDGGLFNLSIGGETESDVPCGGRIGPLAVPVGTAHVSETAGTGTNLAHYTATIGGECAANGTITLKDGQSGICTITNVRNDPPPATTPGGPVGQTATIEVRTLCRPARNRHRFTLQLGGSLLPLMGCGQTTGPMLVNVGRHVVSELASGSPPRGYKTVIGRDCAADGSISLSAGQTAVCTVKNFRQKVPQVHTPVGCNRLTVTPGRLVVGRRHRIVARVRVLGRPVSGVEVRLTGLGVARRGLTGAKGRVRFPLTASRTGSLLLRTARQFGCPAGARRRIAVVAAAGGPSPPPFTG